MVRKIAGWVTNAEEEDGLDRAEGRGTINLKFGFDLQARRVQVHCLQLKSGSNVFVEREVPLNW